MKKRATKLLSLLAAAVLTVGSVNMGAVDVKAAGDDQFVYVMQQLIATIDPAKVLDETELIAAINMYDPLFYPDVANKSMDPAPHIATEYTVDESGQVYTVKIRDDVVFQSGNKLTSKDVAYSMERMIAINEGNAWLWSDIVDSVETPDDTTVVFNLKSSYAPFISSLTQLFILDSELVKANQAEGDFGENGDYGQEFVGNNCAGSGPYKMTSWDRQSDIQMEAFEDYWKGWEDGQIKNVQMICVTEEATVKTMLVSGDADMVHMWLNVSAYQEFAQNDDLTVVSDPSAKIQYFPMNTQKAPTDDINVRKAIAYAFDYDTCLNQLLGGSTAAAGPVPVLVPGHNDDVLPIQRDVEKAKECLAESQYSGDELTVSFMYLADEAVQRQFAQLLTANLAEIGITVDAQPVTWAQVTEAATKPETTANLTVISDSLKYPHVDSHTYGIYHSSAAGGYRSMSWYSTPELDEVLTSARTEPDSDKQMELYKEAQQMAADAFPAVYVANPLHQVAMRKNVTGYTFVGLMGYDLAFYSLRVE